MGWTLLCIVVLAAAWWLIREFQDRRVHAQLGGRVLDRLHRPLALSETTDFAEGVHGLRPDVWLDPERAEARWREFEQAGPEYAVPEKSAFNVDGIRTCDGTLYVALYPADRFENLLDFDLYLRYASSVQQDLIRTGKLDRASFVPPDVAAAMAAFSSRLGRVARSPDIPELYPVLQRMELPQSAQWVLDLDYEAWTVSWGSDGLQATAAATQGFLYLFAADDE